VVDAPADATLVVNPTARARGGVVEARVPGEGPCVFLGPDGEPRPTQLLGAMGGEGYRTMVTGQKVRWVLDMMRGTEFAGPQIAACEVRDEGAVHDILLREARVGEDRCDLAELKQQMLALGEQGATMQLRLSVAPVRHVAFATGPIDGFGWACFTA